MADIMRLTFSGNTVNLSPVDGYLDAIERPADVIVASNGGLKIKVWGSKDGYEIPVSNISSTDKGYIKTWWEDMSAITFYPDYANAPGTSITARIINDEEPLWMMYGTGWANKYEGTLAIRRVSA